MTNNENNSGLKDQIKLLLTSIANLLVNYTSFNMQTTHISCLMNTFHQITNTFYSFAT